ncbi:flagellar biosynthesis protein FlhB [Izhakiella australiensis]|uniref:Flagellar biosynthetic protein FlhB n=1 Tax=Izhakiella australiensis TaxID=1926881 RepID=A0A1S8YIM0_9GAMM|nr:flagellar type III secretion system protein FlhB [Izhakiella australiensis]OON38738.1 flagellar biosynthesis protein FlhB [Izhakiella australiensis]
MSAGSGDKSEKPTPGKLRKAKRKGEIPRSRDVSLAALLLAALLCVTLAAPLYKQLMQQSLNLMQQLALSTDDGALGQFMLAQALILFKVIATLLPIPLVAVACAVLPGGWIFVPARIKPDLKKLNPIAGIKRMFSAQQLTEVGKMLIKCTVLLCLLWLTINNNMSDILRLQHLPLPTAIYQCLDIMQSILRLFVFAILLFALLDVPLSRFLFLKKMKMTKKELRDEHKENEGSPQIKAHIRHLQRQMAMGQIQRQVPQADVVIVNPTHFAVALKYDPQKAPAPWIVAKGIDETAHYIRQLAIKHQVDVITFAPLARAIYHSTRINQQIPASLFRPMAQVLTYVMQLKSWRAGSGDKPRLDIHLLPSEEVIANHASD